MDNSIVHRRSIVCRIRFAAFLGTTLRKFKKELKAYKTSKGTVQFSPDKPLPAVLVKKIIKARMMENEERAALKKKA